MNSVLSRLKLSSVLFPAVLLLMMWMLVVSGEGALLSLGVGKLLFWAVGIAYVISYSVTMFIHAVRENK